MTFSDVHGHDATTDLVSWFHVVAISWDDTCLISWVTYFLLFPWAIDVYLFWLDQVGCCTSSILALAKHTLFLGSFQYFSWPLYSRVPAFFRQKLAEEPNVLRAERG